MLKGNLSGFSLGELFQSLAINNHTGTLTIIAPSGGRKLIYFQKGEIKLFSHGKSAAPRIGEMLIDRGVLTRGQLENALATQRESGAMLGKVLVSEGFVSPEDITQALRLKILEELYDLFLWTDGDFEFAIDHCPEDLFDSLQRSVGLSINANAVIMEGLRRLDEWAVIQESVQSGNEVFVATGKPPSRRESSTVEIYGLVDGRASVNEITSRHRGTRFDAWKGLHTLLVEGAVRPLTREEILAEVAAARNAKDASRAAALLRFATQQEPEDAGLWLDLGNAQEKALQDADAVQSWIQSLRLFFDRLDWENAGLVAAKIPTNANLEIEELETLTETFAQLRDVKKALWAGNLLAQKLQEQGEAERAVEVLDSLIDLDPQDLNLRIQVASMTHKHGDTARAIDYYEEVAGELERQKKIKDQLKILRLILELDPKRTDIRQRVAMLTVLLEKIEKRRRRRVTLAGSSVILLIIGTVIPLVYEIKARELFSHANRMEEISLSSREFRRAREAYEELVNTYPLSLKVGEASLALERIAKVEQGYLSEQTEKQKILERQKLAARREREKELETALTEARQLESDGKLAEAHSAYRKVLESLEETSSLKVLFPVRFESSPPGATIFVNDEAVGTTPFVYRYLPGTETRTRFVLRGCDPVERVDVLYDQHTLSVELRRKPDWEQVLESTFRQAILPVDDLLVFPSRDGHVYAFDPRTRSQIWRRKVGRFGDRLSDLHARDGRIFLVTVVGEIAAIDSRTGNPLWITPAVRGPALAAPATSDDGRLVGVSSLKGELVLLDTTSGELVGRFQTENEIVSSPVFVEDRVLVGSTDSHLYGFSTSRNETAFIRELPGETLISPLRVGGLVLVATSDGTLFSVNARNGEIDWKLSLEGRKAHSLVSAGDSTVLVALDDGSALPVFPTERRVEPAWRLGDEGNFGGLLVSEKRLYSTHHNGMVTAWNLATRRQEWRWQASSSVHVPAVILADRIFVASTSGAVQVLEVLR